MNDNFASVKIKFYICSRFSKREMTKYLSDLIEEKNNLKIPSR